MVSRSRSSLIQTSPWCPDIADAIKLDPWAGLQLAARFRAELGSAMETLGWPLPGDIADAITLEVFRAKLGYPSEEEEYLHPRIESRMKIALISATLRTARVAAAKLRAEPAKLRKKQTKLNF